ncbi:hypothetical protein RvY_10621 [Ramazzottius varieornatus]|uniref:Palmitoyltransferase n=1 Tax=Ramazzottius varieornatus TaxID=947166 RepID=A0A1D1VDE0_RAMVA|nr:hypothetical protein RvY_10621 [Ramazzottius varieornatus]
MNQESPPEPLVSLEKAKPAKKSFVPTPVFGHSHPSDIHEEPVDFDDIPEQAQLDYEHRHSCTARLDLWITDLVARHRTSIWWLTICTCVIPLSIFFAIDAPFLYVNVSPVPPLLVAGLFGLCALLFVSTSFMDPGTIKPYSVEMNMALEVDLQNEQKVDYDKPCYVVASGTIRPQWSVKRQYTWVVNGQEVLTDWCYHCNIYKPPRVHHCKLCGRCIGKSIARNKLDLSPLASHLQSRKLYNTMCFSFFLQNVSTIM